jgi:hypothetical protein
MLLCACGATLALLAPATAAAQDQAALEEYTLTLEGVEQTDVVGPSLIEESADSIGEVGVVGEQQDDFSRIAALGAATASPAGLMVALFMLGGVALALSRRREHN